MGRLALPHPNRRATPPHPDLLEALIERTENHWYWLGAFTDDPLGDNAPIYRRVEGGSPFSVVELLWRHANDHGNKRLTLENACGVFACVRPEHWRRRGVPGRGVYTLPQGQGVWPAVAGPASSAVHVAHDDAVHAVCGAGIQSRVEAERLVNCRPCARAWAARGGKIEEVP